MLKTKMLAALVGLALSVSAMGSAEAGLRQGGACALTSGCNNSTTPPPNYLLPDPLDSHSIHVSPYDGNQLVEFATSGRNYYKYLWSTGALIISGTFGDWNTPVWSTAPGNFDTRTVYVSPSDGNQLVESITTDQGQYYKFSLQPRTLIATGPLNSGRWVTSNGH